MMKRRGFLKGLLGVAGTLALAPLDKFLPSTVPTPSPAAVAPVVVPDIPAGWSPMDGRLLERAINPPLIFRGAPVLEDVAMGPGQVLAISDSSFTKVLESVYSDQIEKMLFDPVTLLTDIKAYA